MCASGFGVCCLFQQVCGQTLAENITYLSTEQVSDSACTYTICKTNPAVSILRLDLNLFSVAPPFTCRGSSDSVVCSTSDDPIIDDCICNSFTVSGPGSIAPPVICRYNTEHHMYVAASDDCNTIAFNFAVGKSFDREWEIKVQQYYLKDIININIKGIIYLLTSLLSDKYEAIIFLLLIRLCALQHNSLFVDRLFFQTF